MVKVTFAFLLRTLYPTLNPLWNELGHLQNRYSRAIRGSQISMSYKVLLLDGIDPAGLEVIQRTGSITPIVHVKISRELLLELIPGVDAVVVRSGTAIDREVLAKARQLKVVGRAGVGVDNVDIDAATE